MENNEIMNRLLQDDKQTNSAVKEKTKRYGSGEIQASRIRVVTAKFKVYIVLLLLLLAVLWLNYIPNKSRALDSSSQAYDQAKTQLSNIERDIKIAEGDMEYLCNDKNGVINNEETLKNCLNKRVDCTSLPESWKEWTEDDMHYNLSIPLSYLQVNSLWNEKMPVDEKSVLKNLNEYLIKEDLLWSDRKRVWDILKINIGDPEIIWYWLIKNSNGVDEQVPNFFKVTVDVEIEFDNVSELTGFLYNVEKKLIENSEDRILYKIQSVSYDIVTHNEPQITDISMTAYYYHDVRFNEWDECGNNSKNANTSDGNETDDTANSDWFFQNIFKKFKK